MSNISNPSAYISLVSSEEGLQKHYNQLNELLNKHKDLAEGNKAHAENQDSLLNNSLVYLNKLKDVTDASSEHLKALEEVIPEHNKLLATSNDTFLTTGALVKKNLEVLNEHKNALIENSSNLTNVKNVLHVLNNAVNTNNDIVNGVSDNLNKHGKAIEDLSGFSGQLLQKLTDVDHLLEANVAESQGHHSILNSTNNAIMDIKRSIDNSVAIVANHTSVTERVNDELIRNLAGLLDRHDKLLNQHSNVLQGNLDLLRHLKATQDKLSEFMDNHEINQHHYNNLLERHNDLLNKTEGSVGQLTTSIISITNRADKFSIPEESAIVKNIEGLLNSSKDK